MAAADVPGDALRQVGARPHTNEGTSVQGLGTEVPFLCPRGASENQPSVSDQHTASADAHARNLFTRRVDRDVDAARAPHLHALQADDLGEPFTRPNQPMPEQLPPPVPPAAPPPRTLPIAQHDLA